MSLRSPWMLLFLACVPVLVLAYAGRCARPSRPARLRGLVPTTAGQRGWRHHVPSRSSRRRRLICFASPARRSAWRCRSGKGRSSSPSTSRTACAPGTSAGTDRRGEGGSRRLRDAAASSVRIGVVAFADSGHRPRPTNVTADVIAAIKRLSVGGGRRWARTSSPSTRSREEADDRRVGPRNDAAP
jgi:hypothetical protein